MVHISELEKETEKEEEEWHRSNSNNNNDNNSCCITSTSSDIRETKMIIERRLLHKSQKYDAIKELHHNYKERFCDMCRIYELAKRDSLNKIDIMSLMLNISRMETRRRLLDIKYSVSNNNNNSFVSIKTEECSLNTAATLVSGIERTIYDDCIDILISIYDISGLKYTKEYPNPMHLDTTDIGISMSRYRWIEINIGYLIYNVLSHYDSSHFLRVCRWSFRMEIFLRVLEMYICGKYDEVISKYIGHVSKVNTKRTMENACITKIPKPIDHKATKSEKNQYRRHITVCEFEDIILIKSYCDKHIPQTIEPTIFEVKSRLDAIYLALKSKLSSNISMADILKGALINTFNICQSENPIYIHSTNLYRSIQSHCKIFVPTVSDAFKYNIISKYITRYQIQV